MNEKPGRWAGPVAWAKLQHLQDPLQGTDQAAKLRGPGKCSSGPASDFGERMCAPGKGIWQLMGSKRQEKQKIPAWKTVL